MTNKIVPKDQNIATVFNSNRFYNIDFYQRKYKWEGKVVEKLLEDLFLKFDSKYNDFSEENIEIKADNIDSIMSKFSWYYLNTYITSEQEDKLFIVDGQQRLTTCMLVLLALRNIYQEEKQKENLIINFDQIDFIKGLILISSITGKKGYRIIHEGSERLLEAILKNEEIELNEKERDNKTVSTMHRNYYLIYEQLKNKLLKDTTDKQKRIDIFYFYFLRNVVIVNLDLTNDDVPMVFEVINDRGQGLDSHDILKGKLLSKINKSEIDEYLNI